VELFVNQHRALLLKMARVYVRTNAEKISAEDVARELELELLQLGKSHSVAPQTIAMPDAFFRSIVRHAAGRAKRRHTLIQQVAAGDDLKAVSEDLAALDADLPPPPSAPNVESRAARAQLDEVKTALAPHDRLVFSLLIEDDSSEELVATTIGISETDVRAARDRIVERAGTLNIEGEADRRGGPPSPPETRRETKLRDLARSTGSGAMSAGHVEEPILALIRHGDLSSDLNDAIVHTASCVDCRARLTDGEVERRSLVVMAIEAPRGSQFDLTNLLEDSGATLQERGAGRWTAVVDAAKADALQGRLEARKQGEVSVVTRLAIATPIEVPVTADPTKGGGRARMQSYPEYIAGAERGIDAAEVSAWAQVRHAPIRNTAPSPAWSLFAVCAVLLAVAIAYFLATR
jgi:DNA-directed RNA polymerase specialized sigma24 family protein